MELTMHQIAILLGLTIAQLIAVLVPYWIGRQAGSRQGHAAGYQAGYAAASDKLEAETDEAHQRMSSAERILTATQAELRQTKAQQIRDRLQHAEAIATLQTQLEDAHVLNDIHATLLRQSARTLDLAATYWRPINATLKADQAAAQAVQLRTLAGWLKPQSQPLERAA